jgi:hypothetical protein
MLDAILSRLFGPALDAVGRRLGKGATALALAAFVICLGAVPLVALHFALIGLAVFVAGKILSAIAARVAEDRALNDVLDAVSFAALPFGFALGDPSTALPAVLMMFGLAAQSAASLKFGRGLIGATELLLAFAVACVFPDRFGIVAYVAAVLCFVSAGVRIGVPRRV